MKVEKDELIRKGLEAVKKNLEEDGWQILLENRNDDIPLDIKAVRGPDKIICHIDFNSKDLSDDDDLQKKLSMLKTEAKKTLSYPFLIEVTFDDQNSVDDISYRQIE
jgi:hypothetical protein